MAVRDLCAALSARYAGSGGGLPALREVSLPGGCPARFAGREPQHDHLLLLAGGSDGRDLEEDAHHAHGEGAGRGRQRLPAAALGYAGLPRLVDALLCRYDAALPHPRDRQVCHGGGSQLHPLFCGRHPRGGYAGRQRPRAGEDLRPDAPDHRAGGVLRRYDHPHGLLLAGGALRLQRAPLAGTCRGAETLPGASLRPGYRHAADRAVGRRGVARVDEPHPHGPGADEPRGDAGASLRGAESGPARATAARALPPGVRLPEGGDLPATPHRGLPLQPPPQGDGQGYDSHHGA